MFELERKNKRSKTSRRKRSTYSKSSLKRRTKGGFENVVQLIWGFVKDVSGIGDDFKDCYTGIVGEEPKKEEDAAADATAISGKTTSLSDFFSSLNKIIEFLCAIKDKLLEYFEKGERRLRMIKKLKLKMSFIEKRRKKTLTEAQRKKLFDDIVNWVADKAGKVGAAVKGAVTAVKDKVIALAKGAWDWMKAKFKDFKEWVKALWEKVKSWTVKAAAWIEKFNTATACFNAAKSSIKSTIKDAIKKVIGIFKSIGERAVAISAAFAGSPKDIATVLVGVVCAIPHVVKIVEYYNDKTIKNEWFRWGSIIGRAAQAFTA
jgi:phage-related protein